MATGTDNGTLPQRGREFQSAAEVRSRSNNRGVMEERRCSAAGRPLHQPHPDQQQQHALHQLMARQVALLEEQTSMLRNQMQNGACASQSFQNPDQLFDVLDPSLREAMLSWRASFKKDVSHLVTQTELREKYKKIEDDNAIMRQFEQESTRQWQFPQEYIASAHPVLGIDEVQVGLPYDIAKAWSFLRRKHALECQKFVVEHQKRALTYFETKTDYKEVKQHVNDIVTLWYSQNSSLMSQQTKEQALRNCQLLMDMVVREEVPKAKSRMSEAAASRQKKQAALLEAETKFQAMDPQMLIAMIELDKVAKQCSRKDGTTAKHVELCKTSELAALIRKFPDLHNHFVIKFVDRPSNRAQTGLARRSPTPHPSRKSSSSARRANSRDKATRSSSRTRRSSKDRSSSRTRVTSKGRRSTSRHSDGGKSTGKGGKSKGRGRGRGYGRGVGKGAGKKVKFASGRS